MSRAAQSADTDAEGADVPAASHARPGRNGAPNRSRSEERSRWAGRLVLLLAALVWLPALPGRDLWAPDEPRIAQVADELRAHRTGPAGLWMLHLDGEPYSQKPPLYYWLAATIGAPFGHVDAWAARAPSALAGLACLSLTMAMTRRLFGQRYAPWAATILLMCIRFSELAQRAQLDVLLTACELAAWLAWLRAERGELRRRRAYRQLHVALGMGMLVKGPVALLPLLVIALHCARTGRGSEVRALMRPSALGCSLGPLLAWGAGVLLLAPAGFFQEAVVDNLAGRFLTGTSHIRPLYFYAYQLPLDFLPGAILLPWAVKRAWQSRAGTDRDARSWQLLSIWTLVFVGFFSLSAGKRGLYLLPALPALAVGCSVVLVDSLSGRARLPWGSGWGLAAAAMAIVAAGLALAAGVPLAVEWLESLMGFQTVAAITPTPALGTLHLPRSLFVACAAIGAGGLVVGALSTRRGEPAIRRAAVFAVGWIALQACAYQLIYPALDSERSLRRIAETARSLAWPGEQIGIVDHVAMLPGLLYYAGGEPGRFENLRDHAAIQDFLREGQGQVLISEIRRSWALEPAPHELRIPFRSADRRIWVLAPPGRLENASAAESGPQRTLQLPVLP